MPRRFQRGDGTTERACYFRTRYNARMPARPQFSLRMLLFVTVMVCLAAATIPAPRKVSERSQNHAFVRHAQAFVRLSLCVLLPALLTGGAVARRGYARTFYLGGVLPALVPLLLASSDAFEVAYYSAEGIGFADAVQPFETAATGLLWAFVPGIGLACVLFHWFLKHSAGPPRRRFILRSVLLAIVGFAFVAVMLKLPRAGEQPAVVAQLPVRLAFCLTLPALLSVGAFQQAGRVRTFCIGGAMPALLPPLFVCSIGIWDPHRPNTWETTRIFELRHFIVAVWALVPCFGFTSVFFHWLFQSQRKIRSTADRPPAESSLPPDNPRDGLQSK